MRETQAQQDAWYARVDPGIEGQSRLERSRSGYEFMETDEAAGLLGGRRLSRFRRRVLVSAVF